MNAKSKTMSGRKIFVFTIISLQFLILACTGSKRVSKNDTVLPFPPAAREFRAAWVATVANISWPSKPGLAVEDQKKEAITLLDFLQTHHFNAVIFQARPQCDALYNSQLEPWSYFLSGEQGKAPSPYYDPLEFWIKEAHDRGIELHVWLNPYRAHHKDGNEISDQSIVKKHPELVVKLKEGYWWLDPSKKATQDHSVAVVMDLVKRYDIDGVHFDDYFYPYPSYNGDADFPDEDSWKKYQADGGKLSRADWRRNGVNVFIERLYKNIKQEKPFVKFGISPFGIWRPGYPQSIQGFDQYDQLYADAKLWLNKGWIDYFTPQLYWPINRMAQSFPVLLGWWSSENTMSRHLWPGISLGTDTSARNVNEIMSQVMISRGMLPESKGIVHWSIGSLTRNPNMSSALLRGPYQQEALVPASSWLDNKAPVAPTVNANRQQDKWRITWTHPEEGDVFRWVLYYKYEKGWQYIILNKHSRDTELSSKQPLTKAYLTAIDRSGNESKPAEIMIRE
jgi:uncharacterized lipoprotein YddW (UPF0748 family)